MVHAKDQARADPHARHGDFGHALLEFPTLVGHSGGGSRTVIGGLISAGGRRALNPHADAERAARMVSRANSAPVQRRRRAGTLRCGRTATRSLKPSRASIERRRV
jgi:hypothetical protein